MPSRAHHLPNVYERDALQKLGNTDLPPHHVGTLTIVAKLTAKGWIDRDRATGLYKITAKGRSAVRAKIPTKSGPAVDVYV
jgi:hypothetical protein